MADQYMSTLTPTEVDQALRNVAQVDDKVAQAEQAAQQAQQYAESINPANFVQASGLLDLIYPVGSIYTSANNVSPQTFLGGTWQQIQGRFLLAADGATYPAGSTGGEAAHALTAEENGPHAHAIYVRLGSPGNTSTEAITASAYNYASPAEDASMAAAIMSSSGSGQAHNNMPPYLAVYMWQRTA